MTVRVKMRFRFGFPTAAEQANKQASKQAIYVRLYTHEIIYCQLMCWIYLFAAAEKPVGSTCLRDSSETAAFFATLLFYLWEMMKFHQFSTLHSPCNLNECIDNDNGNVNDSEVIQR